MKHSTINEKIVMLKDLGMKFPTEISKKKCRYGLYKCYCGNEFQAIVHNVNKGNIKSCGCLQKEKSTKHGLRKHRLYGTWLQMMHRCNNPKNKSYKYYGLIGITICDRWHNIENFIEDMYPSYQEGLTLDRENNSLGYNKDNCRWVSKRIKTRNTRRIMSTNNSNYRGVSWNKQMQKYRASITVNNKQIHLGLFTTALEGAKAYDYYVLANNLEHTINGVGI